MKWFNPNKLALFCRDHREAIGLILIQALSFHIWLFSNALFTFGDVGVLNPVTQRELFQNALSVYVANVDFGSLNIAASSNPFLFLFGILGQLGVGYALSMKLLVFLPAVFGAALTSYILIRTVTGSRRGAFFGALFYSYNTYFLITLTGALYISLAYAFSPLAFLQFYRLLQAPTFRKSVAFALLLTLLGVVEFRVLYINLLIDAVYFLVYLAVSRPSLNALWERLRLLLLSGLLLVLLNLYWLLPLLLSRNLGENTLFSRGLFGNPYFDIVNAFAVFHPWWTGGMPSIFIKQQAPFFFLVFPILFLAAFLAAGKKKRAVLPFLVLYALGVFLTKQASLPLEDAYLWLYRHIPGFNAFREASKFFLISALAGAILLGFFFALKPRHRLGKGGVLAAEFFLIAFFLIQAVTVARSSLGTLFIPRTFPQEYHELNKTLEAASERGFERVLWVPHTSRFATYSNALPAVSLLTNLESRFAPFGNRDSSSLERSLRSTLKDEGFYDYLSQYAVGTIVVPSHLQWDDVRSPWKEPEQYVRILDQREDLKRLVGPYEAAGIRVYENTGKRPRFFASTAAEREERGKETEVKIEKSVPGGFVLRVPAHQEPLHLHFSEAYHPGWLLYEGGKPLGIMSLLSLGEAGETGSREKNYGTLVYQLPSAEAERSYTLYFSPQRYYLLGGALSLLTLCASLLSLGYARIRHKIA